MRLFKKMFCSHKWKLHAKKEYRWEEENPFDGETHTYSNTYEVLICENCGKIKKIRY